MGLQQAAPKNSSLLLKIDQVSYLWFGPLLITCPHSMACSNTCSNVPYAFSNLPLVWLARLSPLGAVGVGVSYSNASPIAIGSHLSIEF